MKRIFLFLLVALTLASLTPTTIHALTIDPHKISAFPGGADQPPVFAIPGGADQPPIFVIPGGADQPPQFGLDNIVVNLELMKANFVLVPGGADQPPKKSATELFASIIDFAVPPIASKSPEAKYVQDNRSFLFLKVALSTADQTALDYKIAKNPRGKTIRIRGTMKIISNPIPRVVQPMIAILKRVNEINIK